MLDQKFGHPILDGILKRKHGRNYATWVVSNCNKTYGASKRMEFALQLINDGLKFEGFGECWDSVVLDKWNGMKPIKKV